MNSRITHNRDVCDSYLNLIKEFPLESIRDDKHLTAAQRVLDSLLLREPLDEGADAYLEALSDLIAHYESQHVPIGRRSGVDVLRYLMKSNGMTAAELVLRSGVNKTTISQLLNQKRQMTRDHMIAFGEVFGIPPAVFMPKIQKTARP